MPYTCFLFNWKNIHYIIFPIFQCNFIHLPSLTWKTPSWRREGCCCRCSTYISSSDRSNISIKCGEEKKTRQGNFPSFHHMMTAKGMCNQSCISCSGIDVTPNKLVGICFHANEQIQKMCSNGQRWQHKTSVTVTSRLLEKCSSNLWCFVWLSAVKTVVSQLLLLSV